MAHLENIIAIYTMWFQILFILVLMIPTPLRKLALKLIKLVGGNQTLTIITCMLALFLFASFMWACREMNYLRREKGAFNQNDVLSICSHDKKIREGERNVNMLGWINFNWVILFGFTCTIRKMDKLEREAADIAGAAPSTTTAAAAGTTTAACTTSNAATTDGTTTTTTTTTESTAESKKDK